MVIEDGVFGRECRGSVGTCVDGPWLAQFTQLRLVFGRGVTADLDTVNDVGTAEIIQIYFCSRLTVWGAQVVSLDWPNEGYKPEAVGVLCKDGQRGVASIHPNTTTLSFDTDRWDPFSHLVPTDTLWLTTTVLTCSSQSSWRYRFQLWGRHPAPPTSSPR